MPTPARTAFGAPAVLFPQTPEGERSFNAFIEKREEKLSGSTTIPGTTYQRPSTWSTLMGRVNSKDNLAPIVAALLSDLRATEGTVPYTSRSGDAIPTDPLADVAYTRHTREDPTVLEEGKWKSGMDPAKPSTWGDYEKADRIIQALGESFAATKVGGGLHGLMSPGLLSRLARQGGHMPSQKILEDAYRRRGDPHMLKHSSKDRRLPRQTPTYLPETYWYEGELKSGPQETGVQQKRRDMERMAIQSLLHSEYPQSSLAGTGHLREFLAGNYGGDRIIKEGEPGHWADTPAGREATDWVQPDLFSPSTWFNFRTRRKDRPLGHSRP